MNTRFLPKRYCINDDLFPALVELWNEWNMFGFQTSITNNAVDRDSTTVTLYGRNIRGERRVRVGELFFSNETEGMVMPYLEVVSIWALNNGRRGSWSWYPGRERIDYTSNKDQVHALKNTTFSSYAFRAIRSLEEVKGELNKREYWITLRDIAVSVGERYWEQQMNIALEQENWLPMEMTQSDIRKMNRQS